MRTLDILVIVHKGFCASNQNLRTTHAGHFMNNLFIFTRGMNDIVLPPCLAFFYPKSSVLFVAVATFVHHKCLPSDSILSNEFCLMPSIKVLGPQGLRSLQYASTFVRDPLSYSSPVASIQGLS